MHTNPMSVIYIKTLQNKVTEVHVVNARIRHKQTDIQSDTQTNTHHIHVSGKEEPLCVYYNIVCTAGKMAPIMFLS